MEASSNARSVLRPLFQLYSSTILKELQRPKDRLLLLCATAVLSSHVPAKQKQESTLKMHQVARPVPCKSVDAEAAPTMPLLGYVCTNARGSRASYLQQSVTASAEALLRQKVTSSRNATSEESPTTPPTFRAAAAAWQTKSVSSCESRLIPH